MSKEPQKMIGRHTVLKFEVGISDEVRCDFRNPNETRVPINLDLKDSYNYYDVLWKIYGKDQKEKIDEYNQKVKEISDRYTEKGQEILELFNNILYAECESMAREIEQLFKEYTSKRQDS
jgi:hypothetical protein